MAPSRSTLSVLAITASAIAILSPVIYLNHKRRALLRSGISVTTTVNARVPAPDTVRSIPQALRDAPGDWLISHEAAAKAVPRAQLAGLSDAGANLLRDVLVPYLRANMQSFTRTPQAPLLRSMVGSAEARATFSREYLAGLAFAPGALVCGVFRVVCREGGGSEARVEMALDPGPEYTGPRSEGRLVSRVEVSGEQVVFFNDTVMWRKRRGGKPELLESRVGSWLHELMVLWLVDSGVRAVTSKPT